MNADKLIKSARNSKIQNQFNAMVFDNEPMKHQQTFFSDQQNVQFSQQSELIFELNEMETTILLEDNYSDIKLDLNVQSIQIEENTVKYNFLNVKKADKSPRPSHLKLDFADLTNPSRERCIHFDQITRTQNLFSKIMSSPLDVDHDESECQYKDLSNSESDASNQIIRPSNNRSKRVRIEEYDKVDHSNVKLRDKQPDRQQAQLKLELFMKMKEEFDREKDEEVSRTEMDLNCNLNH